MDRDSWRPGVPHHPNPPDAKVGISTVLVLGIIALCLLAAIWASGCSHCCPRPPEYQQSQPYVNNPHPCPDPRQVWAEGYCVWPAGDPGPMPSGSAGP